MKRWSALAETITNNLNMCGIAGIWSNKLVVDDARSRVATMTQCVRHRGPDDEGVEVVSQPAYAKASARQGTVDRGRSTVDGGPLLHSAGPSYEGHAVVVFGHRRLSILDLSSAGHQPMLDPTAGNWITYNGEIYNFREIRAELEGRGHIFRSQCDTEVILKAYSEWGVGCWRRLRGIFAFGLWDAKFRELHLVRDHLGVKPLYFTKTAQGLAFSSEVRAILASGLTESRLSTAGLVSFLKYGSAQEPCTLVEDVMSLPPGHYLTCDHDGAVAIRQFWSVNECVVRNWERQPAAAEVLGILEDSVRRQLMADVPVGVFLSSGLDSTAVAALAARAQPGAVRTFCVGTEVKEFDESEDAARTAAALGCQHTTLVLDGRTVREKMDMALNSYDQPSYDGINTYFISMLVRQAGIKVALSGLGGDELFVGYSGFRKGLKVDQAGRMLGRFPLDVRQLVGRIASAASVPGDAAFGAVAELLNGEISAPYFASRTLFSQNHIVQLLGDGRRLDRDPFAWEEREYVLARQARSLSPVDRVSFFELQTYMLSTLLRDSDQMSMAHGLELRVPLIDPEVVEHVLPIPTEEKTAGGISKRVLLDALQGIIPAEVAQREKKGFTLPFRQWLERDLRTMVESRFMEWQPRGPWDRKVFREVWQNFKRGRVAWSRVLTLFVLETWLQQNRINA